MWLFGLLGIWLGPIDDFEEGPSYLTLRIRRVGSLNAGVYYNASSRLGGWRRSSLHFEVIFTR